MAESDIVGQFSKGLGGILNRHLEAESGSKGDDWQIDVFVNDFEDEFPFDPDAPNSPYPTYSPEANRAVDGLPYGQKRDNRPKIHELNQPELAKNRGWRIIDFYPERDSKDEFYRLAGTPSEIRLMVQILRHTREIMQRFGGGEESPPKQIPYELKQLASSPYIAIEFREEKVPEGKRTRLNTVLTIALTEWVENSKFKVSYANRVLGVPEFKKFANQIKAAYFPNPQSPYILNRGNEVWSYSDWPLGYHNWFPARNQASALDAYQKLVTIKGDTFNDASMRRSTSANPAKAYPVNAEPIFVAGQPSYLPERFRNGECKFWKAWIYLPKTRQKIILVSRSKRSPVDNRLL